MASFDAAYFDRFYESKRTRIYGKKRVAHLARGVLETIAWLGGEVRSVLDVGAGPGHTRDWFKRHAPRVRYVSTDVSAYACERYGHERRDISTWRSSERFDLIFCQGVLPYLSDADAAKAIDNLGRMAKGFLYLEAITKRDIEDVCDVTRTDTAVHVRPLSFYRRHLEKRFRPVGCGLFYSLQGKVGFYELEAPGWPATRPSRRASRAPNT